MARAFVDAKSMPDTLQTFINETLGESWEEKGDTLEPGGLLSRREAYTKANLPAGVRLIVSGTDVQEDRLESTVWGYGADEEAWRIEHVILRGDPGSRQLWAEHDDLLRRRYRTDDGRELMIEAAAIDSGGHFTETVYRYAAARKRFRVWAIKGVGGPGRLAWPKKPSKSAKIRVALFPIGVDTIKSVIYGRLAKISEPGPGCIHFDAEVDETYLEQLTSEQRTYRISQGRRIPSWKPRSSGIAQEALDCAVYAYAAMIGRGGAELLNGRASSSAPVPEAPVLATPEDSVIESGETKPRKLRPRAPSHRRGWIRKW
jgi:phage terminase large subunit GpA-like protein